MQDSPSDPEIERKIERWAASQRDAGITPDLQRRIRKRLGPSLTPVKPIPVESWLVLRFLSIFVICAGGLSAVMSKTGFHLMTGTQIGWLGAIIGGASILFSLTLARQMVPGSRRGLTFPLALVGSGVSTIGGIALSFPWQTSGLFVPEGWSCAVLEVVIALPAAAIFWLLARQGALFASPELGATLLGLAAFLALTPLQVQCMFQQAPHLLVWHGGTAAVLIGIGAFVGRVRGHTTT